MWLTNRCSPHGAVSRVYIVCPMFFFAEYSLSLHALMTIVNTCDGEGWFMSIMQLQLASLQLCVVCRSVPALHLIVDENTPRYLWAGNTYGPEPYHLGGSALCWTRVPAVRACKVTWKLPVWILEQPRSGLAAVTHLTFWHGLEDCHNERLDAVVWPPRLETVELGFRFNQPIDWVRWPACLRDITFGGDFNQPITASLPASLRCVHFNGNFDQSLDWVRWPAFLDELTLGHAFNHPIAEVEWPASLRQLSFGDEFDQPIDNVLWPPNLEELTFGFSFSQPIDCVLWPGSLEKLAFGRCFQAPLNGIQWPASLRQLTIARKKHDPVPAWPGVRVRTVWHHWWY